MNLRVELQFAEAFGDKNRWFCSQSHGRKIEDPEVLLAYYIKNGGAADFQKRYDQAMGEDNRWYCSEFYGREIRIPKSSGTTTLTTSQPARHRIRNMNRTAHWLS